ncbi:MAG: hypothetical protein J5843_01705 [Clostridia bacterium]|nr:hypothetical protein [Clostridia bacterium]
MKPLSKRAVVVLLAAFVLLLIAELALSNFTALTVVKTERVELSLRDAVCSGSAAVEANGIRLTKSGNIRFQDLSVPVRSVSVRLSSEQLNPETVVLSLLDESAADSYHVFTTGRAYTQGTSWFRIRSSGLCDTLRLNIEGKTDCLIEAIVLNDAPPFSFHYVRFLLVFILTGLLIAVWDRGIWKHLFKPDRGTHRAAALILLLLTILFIGVTMQSIGLTRIPLDSGEHNAYEELFASLLKGRVDLDGQTPVDPSVLEGLANPYDVTERSSALSGIDAIWDRAYYNGHFYCYFGIAPIFTVYFPFYLLTGFQYIPSAGLAALFLLAGAAIGIFTALNAAAKTFGIEKPLVLGLASIPAVALCFFLPVIGSSSDMYYLPIASGVCCLAWTLAFGFGAFLSRRPLFRRILVGLSGLFLALTAASRPPLALYGLILIPLFVSWIRKEKTWWKEALPFALPLLAGGVLIGWYNFIRFGSPLEFGAQYQLTVHDIRSAGLSLSLLGESFVHYFLQPPAYSGLFPYLTPGKLDLASYGVYFYSARSIGVFHMPVAVLPYLGGFTKNRTPLRTATYLLGALLPVGIAFLDLCLAGACIRYVLDIVFPLAFFGILLLWEWGSWGAGAQSAKTGFRFFLLLLAVLTAGCAAGFALTFANERSWILTGSTDLFRAFEAFFSAR